MATNCVSRRGVTERTVSPFKNKSLSALMLMVLAFFVIANTSAASSHGKHGDHKPVKTDCDIQGGACNKTVEAMSVQLDIGPRPVTAMQDLTFTLTVSGDLTKISASPYIDLGMPGMKMGPNRVALKEIKPGNFEGTGVIVRCPSGKRVWRATVVLSDQIKTEFTFDVVY